MHLSSIRLLIIWPVITGPQSAGEFVQHASRLYFREVAALLSGRKVPCLPSRDDRWRIRSIANSQIRGGLKMRENLRRYCATIYDPACGWWALYVAIPVRHCAVPLAALNATSHCACNCSAEWNEKNAQRDANTARWRSQTFSPRHRPTSRGHRTAKIQSAGDGHYLYIQTQFGEDRCTQFRVIVVTDPQTHKATNHRQDRLQYTAPLSLARSVIK